MSHWNYRVVRVDGSLQIHDVYYNDAGKPNGRSLPPSYLYGETIEHLREQFQLFSAALDKPILNISEFMPFNQEAPFQESGEDV